MTTQKIQKVDLGYKPRPLQHELTLRTRRFNCIVCHRGFGKSVWGVNMLISAALQAKHTTARFQYIAPLLKQAKDIAWNYLKHYSLKVPGTKTNESELYVEFPHNGARVTIYGADNPHALRGLYFDGVVLDEYAQMHPALWTDIIRPRIDDHMGWAIFIGTPLGQNDFYDIYMDHLTDKNWFVGMYKASQTGIYTPQQLEEIKKEQGEDKYEQEFECSFVAALIGAYYSREMKVADEQGRITDVPWKPHLPVITAWDIGIGDATSIWFFQRDKQRVNVIDFYETSGAGMPHYVKILREKGYTYETHIFPHDMATREMGTGMSRQETLRSLGVWGRILPRFNVEDGIQAGRNLIPQCWFDRTKCEKGLKALRNYQREWNEKLQTFSERPRHDWSSHAADAWRYGALGLGQDWDTSMKPIKYPKPGGGSSRGSVPFYV